MANKVSRSLNSYFGGDFLAEEGDLLQTIEDYFCFESEEEIVDDLDDEFTDDQDPVDLQGFDGDNDQQPSAPLQQPTTAAPVAHEFTEGQQSNEQPPTLDERHEDVQEARKITKFLEEGCQCELDCCRYFPRSYYELIRNQCAELSHETLDMVIMGQLLALTPGGGYSAQCQFLHKGRKVNENMYTKETSPFTFSQ